MKYKFTKYIAALVILFTAVAVSAQSYEEELREQMAKGIEAWNAGNVDGINTDSFQIGFGFRTYAARISGALTPEIARAGLQAFLDSLDYYRIIPLESNITIDGNIALVWSYHVEEIEHKGQDRERVTVRGTATYKRDPDGTWKALLTHRDIQEYDENGRYIPNFTD